MKEIHKLWLFFLLIVAVFALVAFLQNVPVAHECPKLMASMLEKQPVIGCLI